MELLEAIRSRKSIRAFKPNIVPEQVLLELLEAATWAPSSVNLQPWEFFVVTGEVLEDLKDATVEQFRLGIQPHPELNYGRIRALAPVLKGVYRERQVRLAKRMFRLLEIGKEDKEKLHQWYEKMYRFYDAPAIVIIAVDKILQGAWITLDIGLVTQTIALAAQEYGLGTCIMRAIVDYPEQVRKIVDIPPSKQLIIGVAIGYPDWDHPVNHLKTEREVVDRVVTLRNHR